MYIILNLHTSNEININLPASTEPANSKLFSALAINKSSVDRPVSMMEYPLGFEATISEKLGTISMVLGHYIKVTLVPFPLAFYYGYSYFEKVPISNPQAIVSLFASLILLIAAIVSTYRQSPIGLGLWIFILSIMVFSNLYEPVAGMAADRLTYVSSLGYCMALGFGLSWLYDKFQLQGKKVIAALTIVIVVSYSGMTIARNAQWKNALVLMRNDIKHVNQSCQAHNLLATHLMRNSFYPKYAKESRSMHIEAIGHFKDAVAICPEFFNVWYDLGRSYMVLNDPIHAISCFKAAYQIDSSVYDITLNVALLSNQIGDTATSIIYYGKCISNNPEMLQSYSNLSYLYFRMNRFEESIAVNQKAIAYNPNWPEPYDNITRVYSALNQPEKAEPYLKKLQELR